jgi:hypothetical protein
MTRLEDLTYKSATATIAVARQGAGVQVRFSGIIEDANPGLFMDPLLDGVHAQVVAQKLPTVVVDLAKLGFLNSSGIKSLIKWVTKRTQLPEAERYAIQLNYSDGVTWQLTSLKAITYLGKGGVTLQPV